MCQGCVHCMGTYNDIQRPPKARGILSIDGPLALRMHISIIKSLFPPAPFQEADHEQKRMSEQKFRSTPPQASQTSSCSPHQSPHSTTLVPPTGGLPHSLSTQETILLRDIVLQSGYLNALRSKAHQEAPYSSPACCSPSRSPA